MKISTLALLIVLLAAVLAAQVPASPDLSSDPRVRWLQKEAVKVRTVDPADGDFRDLQPLKKVIGDAQIVMLGEISHGDGTTMLAKSRLVKFLHQHGDHHGQPARAFWAILAPPPLNSKSRRLL